MLDPVETQRRHWPEMFDFRLLSFLLALHRARAAEIGRTGGVFSEYGLSLVEFDVLAALRRSPPPRQLTPSELQGAMAITSGGLTKILRQLEGRKLVARSTAEVDRRIKPVRLTVKGARLIEQAMAGVMKASRSWVCSALSDKEIDQLTALLGKIS